MWRRCECEGSEHAYRYGCGGSVHQKEVIMRRRCECVWSNRLCRSH